MITVPFMLFAPQITGEKIPPEFCAISGDGVILIKGDSGNWLELDPKESESLLLVSLRDLK